MEFLGSVPVLFKAQLQDLVIYFRRISRWAFTAAGLSLLGVRCRLYFLDIFDFIWMLLCLYETMFFYFLGKFELLKIRWKANFTGDIQSFL